MFRLSQGATHKNKDRKLFIIKSLRSYSVLEAGLEPAQPQWPRDFKSLAQFHHSSILIFSYSVINQLFILSRLYIKRCNKNVWFNSQFNSVKETKKFNNKINNLLRLKKPLYKYTNYNSQKKAR